MTQITIAANDAVDQYAVGSTPTTGPFTISYPYFNENDIKVYVDGVLKTITTHYTISGTAVDDGFSGGTVTFVSNISNVTLTLNRDVPIARESDFPTSGIFNIGTLNTTLDKAYAILQQINTIISRAISRPSTSPETYSLVWPDGFDTTERTVKVTTSGGIEVGPSVAEINNAASNAAATAADLVLTNADVVTTAASATLSTNYATKIDGAVTGSDYASKAWAIGGTGVTTTSARGAAKEWATSTGAAVDTSEFSSKEYSQGTTVSTGSSKQWALGGASFDVDTVVAGGEVSAKKYAANAAASAAQAASGQIYSTVVNQTGAALSPALSAHGTYYLCDTSSNDITVTLPAIGTAEGTKYAFQKTSASNSLIFQRSGTDTLNGSASDITITDVNAQIQFVADDNSPDNWVGVQMSQITVGAGLTKVGSVVSIGDDAIVPSMVQGTVNAQTGTTYTLVIGDAFKTVTMSNGSANTLTIPPNSSVAFAVGDRVDIVMLGAGTTSVVGGSGVTVNGVSTGTGAIAAQYGAVSCLKIATDTWLLMGNHGGVA